MAFYNNKKETCFYLPYHCIKRTRFAQQTLGGGGGVVPPFRAHIYIALYIYIYNIIYIIYLIIIIS